jgi:hypothetical protein
MDLPIEHAVCNHETRASTSLSTVPLAAFEQLPNEAEHV